MKRWSVVGAVVRWCSSGAVVRDSQIVNCVEGSWQRDGGTAPGWEHWDGGAVGRWGGGAVGGGGEVGPYVMDGGRRV